MKGDGNMDKLASEGCSGNVNKWIMSHLFFLIIELTNLYFYILQAI